MEYLERLDGPRGELCLLLPPRVDGRVTPADETVFRRNRRDSRVPWRIQELLEQLPDKGRIRGRGRAAESHAGRHQVGPEPEAAV